MEVVLTCLTCFTALVQRRSAGALKITEEAMRALNENTVRLLDGVTTALNDETQPQDLVLKTAEIWAKGQGDERMTAFCRSVLTKLNQTSLREVLQEVDQTQQEANLPTISVLCEIYSDGLLDPQALAGCMRDLRSIPAHPLTDLFLKFRTRPNATTQVVTGFIRAVFHLCMAAPANTPDICHSLTLLLEKPQADQLLWKLSTLTNIELVGSLLTTARLLQDATVLQNCTELSELLVYAPVEVAVAPAEVVAEIPDISRVAATNTAKLVQDCLDLLREERKLMGLCDLLLTEAARRPDEKFLYWIPVMSLELVKEKAEAEQVQGLAQLLVTSRDPQMTQIVRELKDNFGRFRDRLVTGLRAGNVLSVDALKELIFVSRELVHVTASTIRFFDSETNAWGQTVILQQQIVANDNSRWLILKDDSIFSCGGEVYSGYDASRSSTR